MRCDSQLGYGQFQTFGELDVAFQNFTGTERVAWRQRESILGSMVLNTRFDDRFLADTYAADEPVQLDYGDAASAVLVPERLFVRAQCVAQAYGLHLLPVIDIYSRTRLNRPQCETLLDEIYFVAMVLNDELLREHLGRVQTLISECVAVPQRELLIEGP